jgi:hypothetical protein
MVVGEVYTFQDRREERLTPLQKKIENMGTGQKRCNFQETLLVARSAMIPRAFLGAVE